MANGAARPGPGSRGPGDQGGVRGRPPRRGLQFLDEPGLADAALAFQQHGSAAAVPRGLPGADQLGEVLVPVRSRPATGSTACSTGRCAPVNVPAGVARPGWPGD